MGRVHRRESESGIHHVMNRGVDHQAIFRCDEDRLEMGSRLAEIHERFEVPTLAYCLMGNHFHLILHAPAGVLPRAMHHLTSTYSHVFNARHRRDGPLFRNRYLSLPVETDSYLLAATRYVHRNPLDIAGVRSPRGYRWTSLRAYLGLRPCPSFLDIRPVMQLMGTVEALASFTEDATPPHLDRVEDLLALVRCALTLEDRAEANLDRTVLLLIRHRTTHPQVRKLVDEALGWRSEAAAVRARQRAELRLRDDAALARALSRLEDELPRRRTA